ncbi:DUF2461 family protein [Micromonospora deserti]|uniref:TIGR02453 family protein n=1 Tax=Micromonospora deserti TaxID=2070366 RepID=A0A2W2BYS9_9ACTN|nr:DUF2461 family protein [Micromonospora deserti]PZF91252.1 hypothetical protein C1I99_23640 [Micromonospora deserti]
MGRHPQTRPQTLATPAHRSPRPRRRLRSTGRPGGRTDRQRHLPRVQRHRSGVPGRAGERQHQAVLRRAPPHYQQQLLEPSKAFVVALGAALRQRVSPQLRAEPRIGGSLFRIANDLRFAKDKPPYKPHLDFAFWQGDAGPRSDPSLILRITPTQIHLGAGMFALTGVALDRYRAALRDPGCADELDAAVTALIDKGAELSESTRVRPPAGFTTEDPAGRFAVRDGFHVTQRFPHPAAITTAGFVTWCTERLALYAPIHQWLSQHTATTT